LRHALVSADDYDKEWNNAKFMGFAKGEGSFLPEDAIDQKLFLANEIAF